MNVISPSQEFNKEIIKVEPDIFDKSVSFVDDDTKATKDKMYIYYTLLHTLPKVNKNGVSFDTARTRDTAKTILNGYINLEHEPSLNIGSVVDSSFIESSEGGKIDNKAVLWKSVMEEFGISKEDIENGKYQMSMEVLYKDYYYMVGDERVEPEDNEFLEDYKGDMYEGKKVKKVLYPHEFTGAALTSNAADDKADIFKAIASKYNTNEGGNDEMSYKVFETEEEFNEFKEELAEDIKSELKEDDSFLEKAREGYIQVEDVLKRFEELELGEAETLDEALSNTKELKNNFVEFKNKVAKERKLNERAKELSEFDIDIAELEEDKEEIAEMSDEQFNLMKKTIKTSMEKAKASQKDDGKKDDKKDDGKFDPNLKLDDDEKDDEVTVSDIVKSL